MKNIMLYFNLAIILFFALPLNAQQDINDLRFAEALNLHKQGAFALSTFAFKLELDTATAKKDWDMYYSARNWIAKNYWKQNLLDSAKMEIESILANITTKLGKESLIESQTYNELGVVYDKKGEYSKAMEVYQKCLDIRKKKLEKEALPFGQIYFNIGSCYVLQDKIKQGLEYFEKTRLVFEKHLPPNHLHIGWLYQNLAVTNSKIDEHEKALSYWNKAIKIYLEGYGDKNPIVGVAYNDMAGALIKKSFSNELTDEEIKNALIWYDKSFTILVAAMGEKSNYVANIYIGQGALWAKVKDFKKSKKCFEQAEQIYLETVGAKSEKLSVLYMNVAFALRKQKLNHEALVAAHKGLLANSPQYNDTTILHYPDFTKEISYYSPTTTLLLLAYKVDILGNLYDESKNPVYLEALQNHAKSYEYLCNRILKEFNNAADQEIIASSQIKQFHSIAPYIFELKNYEELFRISEKSKSIFLKKALDYASAKDLGGIPDSLKNKELEYKKIIAEYEAELLQAASVGNDSAATVLQGQLLEHKHDLDGFVTQLEQKFPQYYQLKYQENQALIKDIQAKILDEKTLLLEYFIAEQFLYVLAVSKKEVRAKRIGEVKHIHDLLTDLHGSLSSPKSLVGNPEKAWGKYTRTASELYQLLVADFVKETSAGQGKIEKLVIIPDQSLGRIPFEAFLSKAAPQDGTINYKSLSYLVRDFSIYYAYSASLLLSKNQNKSKGDKILAMASSYNPAKATADSEDETQNKLRKALADLPGAKSEVERLQQFEGDFYFGEATNETAFKKADFTKYSIIHLAMHGVMDRENPMLSSLVFTEKKDSLEDDFLYAYELTNMQIPSQMMVLSACETGDGSLRNTEGIMSLARSCMYAGVPSVVMTLWQVNDLSTSVIIEAFYENIYQGMSKSEALRAAKLSYLDRAEGIAAHPNFWAALVTLGDDSPIVLGKKGGAFWLYGLVGVVLVLMTILVRKFLKKKKMEHA